MFYLTIFIIAISLIAFGITIILDQEQTPTSTPLDPNQVINSFVTKEKDTWFVTIVYPNNIIKKFQGNSWEWYSLHSGEEIVFPHTIPIEQVWQSHVTWTKDLIPQLIDN